MLTEADQEQEDFQRFLRRVDDIANLVQGLNSADPAVKERTIAEAEKRLHDQETSREEESKTTVNRTVINTRASDVANAKAVNADGFLAILEKDAKERTKQRKRNEHLANALKEKGNDAFRKGDYVVAIQRYTEGLEKLKDKQELYTNRAQAYLKMHECEKAITDCEWALKCNEKCIKAYFLMGKAHLALRHYSESRQCYEKILQIDPQKETLFKDCMNEVNLEEKRMKDEERAMKEVQSGKLAALSIKEMLQKLDRPDQNILYYTGGIRLLTGAMKDCTEQTLFRTNNGFSILKDNEIVRRGFCAERKNAAEVDLSVSLLFLWQAVCTGNEENQHLLLTQPDVNAQLPKLLSSGVSEIQKETLALISLYSENENGRRLLVRHQDLTKWLQILMMFVKSTDARASSAMNILSDLTKEERFKTQCRVMLSTGVLPLFTQLLTSAKLVNQAALAHCIGIMGNLCADVVIRMQMAECKECWQACLKLVDECFDVSTPKYQECLFAVLGLMMNLLLESNVIIQRSPGPEFFTLLFQYFAVDISGRCMSLLRDKDGRIVTRAIGVLSRILPASSSAVEEVVKGGVVKKIIKVLKAGGHITSNYGIKTLSICTRSNRQAQEDLVKSDKRFSVLLKLLDSENEMIVGNAAFCLGQCLAVPGAATSLLNSNVVMILLKHAGGDATRTSVQENAAIALGKLCVAESRHIFQLRKLNGLAILNSSMKFIHSI
ncbi:tetratricopeptide repeat protein 12 isoform X1 [Aquila chrysaetos chrysaetos]|uniref:tetratricopeptide repeat protein 12 isoform X1 n=2 Tax=Aquila chrysaetos chrysaetos TaxID=223781 RepID=UPI00117711F9|nr:tetratricopeptide repeat protein 12 isoform X1 [Aquila chrysaetos chrysaetos]